MKSSTVTIEDEPHSLPYLYELKSDLRHAIEFKPKNKELKKINAEMEVIIAFREQDTELSSQERIKILTTVTRINKLINSLGINYHPIYYSPTDRSEDYNNHHDIAVSTQHASCFAVILSFLLGLNNHHSDI